MSRWNPPSNEWYDILTHPKLSIAQKIKALPDSLMAVLQHLYAAFQDITSESSMIAFGGGGGLTKTGQAKIISVPMKFMVTVVKPPTVQIMQPSEYDGVPWRFEIYSPGSIDGLAMFIDVRDAAGSKPNHKSITFERQGGFTTFLHQKSIFVKLGFYSSTAPAIAPPLSGDEGKMFLWFSQDLTFTTYDAWKSHTPVLDGATWLTAYANGVDVYCDCIVGFAI